nr:dolichyl pyrophosphate glc1man9glcnac2 alpha-1,3-glucosyltransferase [Quercus suber]
MKLYIPQSGLRKSTVLSDWTREFIVFKATYLIRVQWRVNIQHCYRPAWLLQLSKCSSGQHSTLLQLENTEVARFVDEDMLHVHNLGHDSWQTIYFQRATVLLTEAVLIYALYLFVKLSPLATKEQAHAAAISILLSPGLLIIDHLHFQYNGFLYGVLILSIVLAQTRAGLLFSGLLFGALLCLKHIYAYLAPAYFIYLLRRYCLGPKSILDIRLGNCLKLGMGLLAVVALAFGPFAYYGQVPQVMSRLFPFARGLCHAYWAPNIWALYSFMDRLLIYAIDSVTRGLVGDTAFAVLPAVLPRTTFILTLAVQTVSFRKFTVEYSATNEPLMLAGTAQTIPRAYMDQLRIDCYIVWLCLFSVRMACPRKGNPAGYHSLHASRSQGPPLSGRLPTTRCRWSCQPVSVTVYLYGVSDQNIIYHLLAHVLLTGFRPIGSRVSIHCPQHGIRVLRQKTQSLRYVLYRSEQKRMFFLDRLSSLYIAAAVPLIVYCSVIHHLTFGNRYEFLPLMLISSYSAVGVVGSWLGFSLVFFTS